MEASSPDILKVPSTDESPAQKQARIRRERREAKIKAGGSARLDKISNLSGRPIEPAPPSADATPSQHPESNDPEEVDITNHSYNSRTASSQHFGRGPNDPTEADLRQILRSGVPPTNMRDGGTPFMMPGQGINSRGAEAGAGAGGADQDPMMRMLQQMMGGAMSGGANGPGEGGLPPELAAVLGGDGQGMNGEVQQNEDNYGYLWKIVHAAFALTLGLYVIVTTAFNGTKLSRNAVVGESDMESVKSFFWVFATAELLLQSTRFFLERGKINQGGILAMVARFLPEPWKGYLGLVSRYSRIYSTVVEDAMVVVFVLGVVAWWAGSVS